MKAFIISSVGCVILALTFMGWFSWGVWGLVTAQLISQCAYNAWHWTVKAHREMELGLLETLHLGGEETKKIISSFLRRKKAA